MRQVTDLWSPRGLHGTVVLPPNPGGAPVPAVAIQASVLGRLRQLIGLSQFASLQYDDIKVFLTPQSDGSTEVFFELIVNG